MLVMVGAWNLGVEANRPQVAIPLQAWDSPLLQTVTPGQAVVETADNIPLANPRPADGATDAFAAVGADTGQAQDAVRASAVWPWVLVAVAGGLGIGIGAYCLGRASAAPSKYFYQAGSRHPDDSRAIAPARSTSHPPRQPTPSSTPTAPSGNSHRDAMALTRMRQTDPLLDHLRSRDAQKRRQAIWELGQRGTSEAIQPLMEIMVNADSQQRSLILGAIAEIGTRTLTPLNHALMVALQDNNADVRKNAIRDLTRVYSLMNQISQILTHATGDADEEVRTTAAWALEQFNQMRGSLPERRLDGSNAPSHAPRLPPV